MPKKNSLNYLLASLKNAYHLLQDGHSSVFYHEFVNHLYSELLSFGLQRDLQEPFENPAEKIKIHIRPLRKYDVDSLLNARWVNTFEDVANIVSLKGCSRAGFEHYILRKVRWFLFRLTISFHPLPKNLLDSYYLNIADQTHRSTNGSSNQSKLQPETQVTE